MAVRGNASCSSRLSFRLLSFFFLSFVSSFLLSCVVVPLCFLRFAIDLMRRQLPIRLCFLVLSVSCGSLPGQGILPALRSRSFMFFWRSRSVLAPDNACGNGPEYYFSRFFLGCRLPRASPEPTGMRWRACRICCVFEVPVFFLAAGDTRLRGRGTSKSAHG